MKQKIATNNFDLWTLFLSQDINQGGTYSKDSSAQYLETFTQSLTFWKEQ